MQKFTEDVKLWIKDNFTSFYNYNELLKALKAQYNIDSTEETIRKICNKMGLHYGNVPKFSKEVTEWIVENFYKANGYQGLMLGLYENFNIKTTNASLRQLCTNKLNLSYRRYNRTNGKIHLFSKNEDDYLRFLYTKHNKIKDVCEAFNQKFNLSLSKDSIYGHAYFVLGLRFANKGMKGNRQRLQEEHILWLKSNSTKYNAKTLVEKFNEKFNTDYKSTTAFYNVCKKYNIPLRNGLFRDYTEEQVCFLRSLSPKLSYKECAKLYNKEFNTSKTASAIGRVTRLLRIMREGNALTEGQKKIIRQNVYSHTYEEILKTLPGTNATIDKIRNYVKTLYVNPKRHIATSALPPGSIRKIDRSKVGKTDQYQIKVGKKWKNYNRYKLGVSDDEDIIYLREDGIIETENDYIIVPKYMRLELSKHDLSNMDAVKARIFVLELEQKLKFYGKTQNT